MLLYDVFCALFLLLVSSRALGNGKLPVGVDIWLLICDLQMSNMPVMPNLALRGKYLNSIGIVFGLLE